MDAVRIPKPLGAMLQEISEAVADLAERHGELLREVSLLRKELREHEREQISARAAIGRIASDLVEVKRRLDGMLSLARDEARAQAEEVTDHGLKSWRAKSAEQALKTTSERLWAIAVPLIVTAIIAIAGAAMLVWKR